MTAPPNTRLIIGPNASLSERQACLFMGWMAALGLGIAGLLTAMGYWPVLPFAGLELGALGAALWVSVRRNRYREVLGFEEDRVCIEFGLAGRGAQARLELPRAWTRVSLEYGEHRNDPTRLLLAYGAQRVEIGRCLTDEEREALLSRIRELLRPAWRAGIAGDRPDAELPLGDA